MTFLYKLDTFPLNVHLQTKNELPRSRLSTVNVLRTDIHTDRHTEVNKHITPRSARSVECDCGVLDLEEDAR